MNLVFKIRRKVYKLFHPVLGEIFMLHRVVNERSVLESNRVLEVSPEFLEQTLSKYKSLGYRFVSLEDVYEQLVEGNSFKQKFVCFTFDDGYVDNYEIAYPLYKKYNCPFTICLTTDFPDKKAFLWWYDLEKVLLENDELVLSDGTVFSCSTPEEKNEVFKKIRKRIFAFQSEDVRVELEKLFCNKFFFDNGNELALSWEQIQELSQDNLCTIASHTMSHRPVTNLTDLEFIKELKESKKIIEQKIQKPVLHFAFPYGEWNKHALDMILQEGYKSALLANGGVIRKGDKLPLLKRSILMEKSPGR